MPHLQCFVCALTAVMTGASAEDPVLPSGCELKPFQEQPAAKESAGAYPPGTCVPDSPDSPKRVLLDGPTGCTGHQARDHPVPMPAGTTCDAAKMTPQLCAAACVAALGAQGQGVVAVAVEYGQECYCQPESAGLPRLPPAGIGCNLKCPGAAGTICGGSNFASVWKVECTAWGGTFLVALAAAGVVYAAGGVAYNIKVRGLSGLDALPHRDFWQELGAYVKDGVDFSRARALGGGARTVGSVKPTQHDRDEKLLPGRDSGGAE